MSKEEGTQEFQGDEVLPKAAESADDACPVPDEEQGALFIFHLQLGTASDLFEPIDNGVLFSVSDFLLLFR